MRFIAQMVGRNEGSRYLREVLEHLNQFVDIIVFTDDASDDNTPDIAEEMGAEVFQLDEPTFEKSEYELRSAAWKNLEKFAEPRDWILCIDADELFYPGEGYEEWLQQDNYYVLGVTFYHMWNKTHYRVDKAWAPVTSSRLFRFHYGGVFRERNLATGSEPTYVNHFIRQRKFAHTDFKMKHLGYMRDEDKKAKYERYMRLDKGDFHSLKHIESILDEDPQLVEWAYG